MTVSARLEPKQAFSAARYVWCKAAPYFQRLTLKLVVREEPRVGTMCVSTRCFLLVSYQYVTKQSVPKLTGCWGHEVLHLYLKHEERRGIRDPKLWNIACDLSINCIIRKMGLALPDNVLYPEQFGYPPDETADTYFALLLKDLERKRQEREERERQEQEESDEGDEGEPSDEESDDSDEEGDEGDAGDDSDEEGDEEGDEGDSADGDEESDEEGDEESDGGSGERDSDEEGDEESDSGAGDSDEEGDEESESEGGESGDDGDEGEGQPQSTEDLLEELEREYNGKDEELFGGDCGSGAGNPQDCEPDEGDPDERDDNEMERALRAVAEAIVKQASKGRGSVPGILVQRAEELLAPPVIPWEQQLRRATRRAVAFKSGAVDFKYDQPSRRQAGIGYGWGKPVLPRLRCPVPRVAAGIDTSASMGTTESRRAVSEVAGVLKTLGTPITFFAIDAELHVMKEISNVADIEIVGGGGTDFRPLFAELEKTPLAKRPDIVVFVTDGQGPAPKRPPKGIHVIWVLVGDYACKPYAGEWGGSERITYGDFITIPPEQEESAA